MVRFVLILLFLCNGLVSFAQLDTALFSGYKSSGFRNMSQAEILKRYGTDRENEELIKEFYENRYLPLAGQFVSGIALIGCVALTSETYNFLQADNAMGAIISSPMLMTFGLGSLASASYFVMLIPQYKTKKWLYRTLLANHLKKKNENELANE